MSNTLEKIEPEMEEKKKEDQVNSFLNESRPQFKSLGCGIHEGTIYFGTRLWREGRGYDAVITSTKKIYINKRERVGSQWLGNNEIKQEFGLNYKDPFYDEALDHIFSNEAIRRFIFEDISDVTFQSVFEKIVSVLKKYMYFENEAKYKLVACYRIAGFFMSVWKVRARLFLYAEAGSSKSRLTSILHNTGFNSVNLGDWTLAFIQRLIESTRGETHIDDYETLDEEKQKATTRLVKVGYMKGFKAGKTADKTRRPEVYDLFNTTTLNNTMGMDFVSHDRCITIRIPKIADEKYDKEPNFEDKIYQEIRDELYILGLKEGMRVRDEYDKVKSEKLSGRLFSIIKPELTIARCVSEEIFKEVENFWEEEINQRDSKELVDDWEFRAYVKIYDIVVQQGNDYFFGLYDKVVKPLIFEMYGEYDVKKYKFKMSSTIGNILSRSPIFKSRKVQGKTQYKVSKDDLLRLLKAKNLLIQVTQYDSTNTTNTTTSTTSTTSTNIGENEVVSVDSVEVGESRTSLPILKKLFKDTKKDVDALLVDEQFAKEAVEKWKREGVLFEPRPGRYKLLGA